MSRSLGELENLLGHNFKDPGLLERAVTHRSWAYENLGPDETKSDLENETLEFIGDSVLGLAIAEQLYLKNPGASEGDLTLMKHRLVSAGTLAEIARKLELGTFVRLGRGEERSGGRNKQALLADTFEAVVGAAFFDGGYIVARALVKRIFADRLKAITPDESLDYKTLLQETLQARKRKAPIYKLVRSEGPSHKKTFWVEAVWDSGRAEGKGVSIKSAEMEAASRALEQLQIETDESG